ELSDHRFRYDANKLVGVIERAGVKPANRLLSKLQNVSGAAYWGIILAAFGLGFAIWMLGSGVLHRTVLEASPPPAGTSVAASTPIGGSELALIRTIPG